MASAHSPYNIHVATVLKLKEIHEGDIAADVGTEVARPEDDAAVPELAGSGGRL
jgi:hypothetical protein